MNSRNIIFFSTCWTILAAWCQISGWILTMLGELNRVGYICLIIVPLVVLFAILCWRPKRVLCGVFDRDSLLRSYARHSCKRQRGFRLFRSIFVCLCIISLVGGVINSPSAGMHMPIEFPECCVGFRKKDGHG